MASSLPSPRCLLLPSVLLLTLSCAKDPWVYKAPADDLTVGGEVYRVFCKRTAKDAAPTDITGTQFDKVCVGEGDLPELADGPEKDRLQAIIKRRKKIVDVIDRSLGEEAADLPKVTNQLETDEIRAFLKEITPLYDTPDELLPGATRNLGMVLGLLADPKNDTGAAALQGLSQITGRKGYRRLDLALGLLRPLFQYKDLDAFAENGLKVIARGGKAEKSLDEMSLGLSLELANYDKEPPAADSTLLIARDLFLSPIDQTDQPEREPVWITKRDPRGVAVPRGDGGEGVPSPFRDDDGDNLADIDKYGRLLSNGDGEFKEQLPFPYRVANEPEKAERDDKGRALYNGELLYQDFDAQPTLAAAFLREEARLTVPVTGNRTALEKVGRGLAALFGLNKKHSVSYGKTKVEFEGPDPDTGAFHDLVHAVALTVRTNPDAVRRVIELLERGMIEHEPEMAQFVQTLVNISERGKMHPEAVLVGEAGPNTEHRFWDDLLEIALRMSKRKGMLEDLVRWVTLPEAEATSEIIANWMQYSDVTKYKGADFKPQNPDGTFTDEQQANLNATAEVKYKTEPDRSQPSVGENRSVWQQTMSMVHNLNQGICNKDKAVLHLVRSCHNNPVACTFGAVMDYPWSGGGYPKCDLFEINHMIRIWVQSILGEAVIELKPPDFKTEIYSIFGVDTGLVQETESQITGFNKNPIPASFARFLYGPPNQFVEKIKPEVLIDGARVELVDPYALFAMEVKHKNANNMSFLEAGRPLVEIFERRELTKPGKDSITGLDVPGALLQEGYLFADLLNTFHMHWGSRSEEPCEGVPACTQHVDPKGKFFSYQTDLRSYEPLLIEAFRDEHLIRTLASATKALDSITIDDKTGIQIIAEFAELLITPNKDLVYRDRATTSKTNVGEDLGYVSPMYMLLDGLKRIDKNFADAQYASAHETWKEGRSDLVDLFLTVEEHDGKKRLKDRVGRSVFLTTLKFLRERVVAHQEVKDLDDWANGLARRSVTFFDTPLVAGLLHLFQQSWDEPASGRELMKFLHFLSNEEKNPIAFETLLVAVADLLQLMEDSEKIAPIMHLAAESVAPGAPKLVAKGSGKADTDMGILRRAVELQNRLLQLHTRRPSTLARVAQNLVNTEANEVQTPVETFIDVISEIERNDPAKDASEILTQDDLRAIAQSAHVFLTDDRHGVERLYDVIQNRMVHPKPPAMTASNEEEQK